MEVGSDDEARAAATMCVTLARGETFDGWQAIPGGRERTVYLSPSGIVYKAGTVEAALAECRRFAEMLRGAMAEHIPAHTMYRFTIESSTMGEQVVGVIAMPYLPHDESIDRDTDARTHKLLAATGDINLANVHAHRGHLWLIDGAGLAGLRDWGR